MNDLEIIRISFSTISDSDLISLLLYVDDKFDDAKNRKLLMLTVRFILDSQRFNLLIIFQRVVYAVTFVCRFAKDFLLPFQRDSVIHYFTVGFFFDYSFNFYIPPIQINHMSGRALFYTFTLFFCFCVILLQIRLPEA